MEMCDIDLGKFIKERKFLPQNEALDMFKQLLKGYKYLYDNGVSHRDLKVPINNNLALKFITTR